MRFFAPIVSVLVAVATAQQSGCSTNCILIPTSGLQVTAGQRFTISWSNPSAGQITIKLQPSADITPNSGITLASNVPASAGSVTVDIPSNLVNSNQYTFETIDQNNPSVVNFSNMFSISGATAVSTMVSSTASSSSHSSSSGSSTSGSTSSASSSSASSSSSSASRTSSESSTRTSSSATSTATTAAPNSNTNAASSLKAEGALIAVIAAAMAVL